MQRLTRSLFSALTPSLMPDPKRPGWSEQYLLQVCEAGVARLAADPRSEPMASRSLFASARSLMRAQDQLRAARIIEAHLMRARNYFEAERGSSGLDGVIAALRRAQPQGQALRPRADLGHAVLRVAHRPPQRRLTPGPRRVSRRAVV